jgi:membrane-associated phospholipid phosphatase
MLKAVFLLILVLASSITAQTPGASNGSGPSPTPTPALNQLEKDLLKNILKDQAAIWTSPFRLRKHDLKFAMPLAIGAAALIATDKYTSRWVSRGGSLPGISRDVSEVGALYTEGAVAGAFYVAGRVTGNYRARETGILAGEALINAEILARVLKAVTQRPRPNEDGGRGRFFTGGNSFPSGHAVTSWSVATVISYEYKHIPLVRYGALAAAGLVTMSRYSGRRHFLSDLAIGSAVGFLNGRYVFKKHHLTPDLGARQDPSKKSTTFMPVIKSVYQPRSHTYAANLTWSF